MKIILLSAIAVLIGPIHFVHMAGNYTLEVQKEYKHLLDRMFDSYDKGIRPNLGETAVDVELSLYITSMREISEKNSRFTTTLYFRQKWNDPRLKFKAHPAIQTIQLYEDRIQKIWEPDTFVVNEISSYHHKTLVPNELVRISTNGDVLKSVRYTVTALCPMDLKFYPFDRQVCALEFESFAVTMNDIRYKWANIEAIDVLPEIFIPTHLLIAYNTEVFEISLSTGNYSRLIAYFMITRPRGRFYMRFFVPMILFVLISLASLWLTKRKSVALINLLNILLISLLYTYEGTAELPKITYMSAVDLYFFMCIFHVFLCLLDGLMQIIVSAGVGKKNSDKLIIGSQQTSSVQNNDRTNKPVSRNSFLPTCNRIFNRFAKFGLIATFSFCNLLYFSFYLQYPGIGDFTPDMYFLWSQNGLLAKTMLLMKLLGDFSFISFIILFNNSTTNVVETTRGKTLAGGYYADFDTLLDKYDNSMRPGIGESPVVVGITLYVVDIQEINHKYMKFETKIYFRQTWKDDRLQFQFPGVSTIQLNGERGKKIWVPDTFIVNEIIAPQRQTVGQEEFVRIRSSGEVLKSGKYTIMASCPMDLHHYPFDSQLCNLEIESFGSSMSDIRYVWHAGATSVGISADAYSPTHFVVGYRLRANEISLSTGNYSRLAIDILFVRSVGRFLIIFFIPMVFIVLLSLASLFLPSNRTAMFINLGNIGITSAWFVSEGGRDLPSISYYTAMDIYFFYSFIHISLCLLYGIITNYFTSSALVDQPTTTTISTNSSTGQIRRVNEARQSNPLQNNSFLLICKWTKLLVKLGILGSFIGCNLDYFIYYMAQMNYPDLVAVKR